MSKVVSALPRLKPSVITNKDTGEVISWEEYVTQALAPLLDWVLADTQRLYDQDAEKVHVHARGLKGSANSYSRRCGYVPSHMLLPREVKAKSRLGELVHHKLMTETAAFERNLNPRKRLPFRFSRTVNLGAVNAQMAVLERDRDQLVLSWKCWEQEYVLVFDLPPYVLKRDIAKWSLPVVSEQGFIFTMQESPVPIQSNLVAGVDLGRVEPFTLAIVNDRQALLAEYRARPQLRALGRKRERILAEVTHTRAKADAYAALSMNDDTLREQVKRLRGKSRLLGDELKNQVAADIARKTTRHHVALLRLEDLKWVTGARYGSRWNHGQTAQKIEHTSARHGVRTKRVNARGTSQHCHSCGSPVVHHTRTRSVWCGECKSRLDRDVNAALNIAKNKSYPNKTNGSIGVTCTALAESETVTSRSLGSEGAGESLCC